MITILYAGILGIFYVALSIFVVQGRWKYKTSLGNGGNPQLEKRIRVHGNFAEYVPFALLLLFLVDTVHYAPLLVHILGIMLVIGRICHARGILHPNPLNPFRSLGVVLTQLVFLVCSVLLIWHFVILRLTAL